MKQSRKALALFLIVLGSLSMAVKVTGPWPAVAAEGVRLAPQPAPHSGSRDQGWNAYVLRFCECQYDRTSDLWTTSAGCGTQAAARVQKVAAATIMAQASGVIFTLPTSEEALDDADAEYWSSENDQYSADYASDVAADDDLIEAQESDVAVVESPVVESKPVRCCFHVATAIPSAALWMDGPWQTAASPTFTGPIALANVPVGKLLAPPTAQQYLGQLQHRVSLVLGLDAAAELGDHLVVGYRRAALKSATGLASAWRKVPQVVARRAAAAKR